MLGWVVVVVAVVATAVVVAVAAVAGGWRFQRTGAYHMFSRICVPPKVGGGSFGITPPLRFSRCSTLSCFVDAGEHLRRVRLPQRDRLPQRRHVHRVNVHLAEQHGQLNLIGLQHEFAVDFFLDGCSAVAFGFEVRPSAVHEEPDLNVGQRCQLLHVDDEGGRGGEDSGGRGGGSACGVGHGRVGSRRRAAGRDGPGGRRRLVHPCCLRVQLRQELLQLAHALLNGRPILGILRPQNIRGERL